MHQLNHGNGKVDNTGEEVSIDAVLIDADSWRNRW